MEEQSPALICVYECTICARCTATAEMNHICPNCSGNWYSGRVRKCSKADKKF
nr:DUF1272 domain-containing protein [Mesobacillus foraminis]